MSPPIIILGMESTLSIPIQPSASFCAFQLILRNISHTSSGEDGTRVVAEAKRRGLGKALAEFQ